MRRSLYAAAIFASLCLPLVSSPAANATTVSIVNQDTTVLPGSSVVTAAASSTGDFIQSTTGTVTNSRVSPFGDTTSAYSVLSSTGAAGSATYNFAPGTTSLSFLWGSPDSYNSVMFFSGIGGTGTLLATFTGSDLTPSNPHFGFDLVTFLAAGGSFASVVLADSGQAAFEYANLAAAPLPAALPLYAAGVGVIGLLARRRKRRPLSA